MTSPTPPAPAPAAGRSADAVLPVIVGTIGWAVALIVLIVLRPHLEASDSTWWIGAAAAGLITGLLATAFLVRRRRRIR